MITQNEDVYTRYLYSYPHKTAYRSIPAVNISDYSAELCKAPLTLYAHIPFCSSRCGFCNLLSVCGSTAELREQYVQALLCHVEQIAAVEAEFNALVIGGGTPLLLSEQQLETLFKRICMQLGFSFENPGIIETSPTEATEGKIRLLKDFDFTRVSIGVQSFLPLELETLRRSHTVLAATKALELLRKYDFDCLNLDLIYGIPGQTPQSWQQSLKSALTFKPEEIFLYPLYIRDNKEIERNRPPMLQLYRIGRDFLLSHGYLQESMRRFTKINNEPQSCGFENMLALGCGGRSYLGNLHLCTPYSDIPANIKHAIRDYIANPDKTLHNHGYWLSDDEMRRRYLIKNLFVSAGMDSQDYQSHFSQWPLAEDSLLQSWVQNGWFQTSQNRLTPTSKGLELSDYLSPQLISPAVQQAMLQWVDAPC